MLFKLLQKAKEKEALPHSLIPALPWYQSQTKPTQERKTRETNVPYKCRWKKKILSKILVNVLNSIVRGLYIMTKWDLSQNTRVVRHIKINQCTTPHYQNEGGKHYMIISFNAEKAFENIWHVSMMKIVKKVEIEFSR